MTDDDPGRKFGRLVGAKFTVYVDADLSPMFTVDDGTVVIEIPGAELSWDIIIDPTVFDALQSALVIARYDETETGKKP